MVVLGSSLSPSPPHPLVILLLGALLVAGGFLGIYLSNNPEKVGLRRLSILYIWMGIAGFLLFQGWAGWMAWDSWNLAPGSGIVERVLWLLADPLHVAASGLVWLLCAGLLAGAMDYDIRKRRAGTVLCSILFLAVSVLPIFCGFEETYGFRSRAVDDAEGVAKGEFSTLSSSTNWCLTMFLVARWRYPLDILVPTLVVLAGYANLRRARRVREALPALEVPMEISHLAFLVLVSAILWGLARVLNIAQAFRWSSPKNSWSLVEETLVRETAAPVAAVALGLLFVLLLPPYRRMPEPTAQPPLR